MEYLIDFFKEQKINYEIGMIRDGYFYHAEYVRKEKQVVKILWKKNSIDKIINKINDNGINLYLNHENKYCCIYDIEKTTNQLLIVYAVNSHVQLPKLLLKNFRTNELLYYMDTSNNVIKKSSASRYNTKFGYYSLFFEEHLSRNYEKIIVDILDNITPFINEETTNITMKNLENKINKLFTMAYFRNPKFVKETNDKSVFAKFFYNGYDAEYLAFTSERMNNNFINGFKPVPLVNNTDKGMLVLKSLISNFTIDGGVESMVMILHPKFAVALIPNSYYKKMILDQGDNTYLLINDEKQLKLMNRQIYFTAKFNNDDVIGFKEDLDDLLESLNFNQKKGVENEFKK